MSPRKSRSRRESDIADVLSPAKQTRPVSGCSIPAINLSSVDLPARRAPHTPMNTPSSSSKEAPSRTTTSRRPSGYRLLTFSKDSRGVIAPITLSPSSEILLDPPARASGPFDLATQLSVYGLARAIHHQSLPRRHTRRRRSKAQEPQALPFVGLQGQQQRPRVLLARDRHLRADTDSHRLLGNQRLHPFRNSRCRQISRVIDQARSPLARLALFAERQQPFVFEGFKQSVDVLADDHPCLAQPTGETIGKFITVAGTLEHQRQQPTSQRGRGTAHPSLCLARIPTRDRGGSPTRGHDNPSAPRRSTSAIPCVRARPRGAMSSQLAPRRLFR